MMPAIYGFLLAVGGSLPASIVAKATVTAALGLIGARVARRNRAAVRHVVLVAALGVLILLPVTSIVAPPIRIAVPVVGRKDTMLRPLAEAGDSVLPLTPPDAHYAATPAISRSLWPPPSTLLIIAWFVGSALSLISMMVGLWKIRLLRRSGLPWTHGQTVVDRLALDTGIRRRVKVLLHGALPGPIASGMLRPAILLPPDAHTWEREDLNRALVHELEHVRRGDFVSHCLARAVCAVYWFHPLVWIAWRQLNLEAERSCDDAVLGRSEATAYADQLVALARRLSTAGKSPILAMANHADLAIRVGAVLDSRQRRGRAGPFMMVLGCAGAAVLVLTMSPLRTVSAPRSASAQAAAENSSAIEASAPLPSIESATVKPSPSGEMGPTIRLYKGAAGFTVTRATTKDLIAIAFAPGKGPQMLEDFQVSGGPSWVNSDKFHIDAKVRDSLTKEWQKTPERGARLMIQSLLVDRFKLRLSHETKELPVYALTIGNNGPKLQQAQIDQVYASVATGLDGHENCQIEPASWTHYTFCGKGQIIGEGISVGILVGMLSKELDRTVLDQTGLQSIYNITLQWTPDQSQAAYLSKFKWPVDGEPGTDSLPQPGSAGPSIFTAIQEQLGLRLESQKGPAVEVFVIDHVERPSEN